MASNTPIQRETGRVNPVLLLLLGVMLAAVLGTAFLGLAPNRIISAKPVMLRAISPWVLAAMAICWCGLLGVAVWPLRSRTYPSPAGEGGSRSETGGALLVKAPAQSAERQSTGLGESPHPPPVGGPPSPAGEGLRGGEGSRSLAMIALLIASVLIILNLYAAGRTASALVSAASVSARVSLGAAFWLILLCAALALSDTFSRYRMSPGWRFGLPMLLAAITALMLFSGFFDDLSLLREWTNRRDSFSEAVLRHGVLVLAALALSLPIGTVLGLIVLRNPHRETAVFAVLNLIQTIPSIALFGLLIGPLTSLSEAVPLLRDLGLRGIGFAPALIALVLYSLLPVARAVHAGFSGVAETVRDSARGMGMTDRQILWQVSFPLAAPVLLAGLRIVTIQLIGLAVVAALIGAGGLGAFVFQGLAQTATDLVLLGAMTAIALALITDAVLRTAISALRGGTA